MGDLIDMTEAAARIKREREGRMRRKADRMSVEELLIKYVLGDDKDV
jgi:hypothetical protein